ncbi:MAG: hypothetical protein KC646_10420 [Candidatus Cloacimonetes bacterium]|nr:hypothetical protein [Candidatus Cloacimonadota bacterium]
MGENLILYPKDLNFESLKSVEDAYAKISNIKVDDVDLVNPDKQHEDLIAKITRSYNQAKEVLESYKLTCPDLLLFLGPSYFDGHSVVFNKNNAITFLDLEVIDYHYQCSGFMPLVHMVHELIHSLHYSMNKPFALQNIGNDKYNLLRHCISEGLATYYSRVMTQDKFDSYWFGLFPKDDVSHWLEDCEDQFRADLQLVLQNEMSVEDQLFSVESNEVSWRRAYHHGSVIVDRSLNKADFDKTCSMTVDDWLEEILQYIDT